VFHHHSTQNQKNKMLKEMKKLVSSMPKTSRGRASLKMPKTSPEVKKIMMKSSRMGSPVSRATAIGMNKTNIAGRKGQLGSPRSARK